MSKSLVLCENKKSLKQKVILREEEIVISFMLVTEEKEKTRSRGMTRFWVDKINRKKLELVEFYKLFIDLIDVIAASFSTFGYQTIFLKNF